MRRPDARAAEADAAPTGACASQPAARAGTDVTPCLYRHGSGRSVLVDANGEHGILREESLQLVFLSESGHRLLTPLPPAWEHLSAEELEVHRRSARPVDPGEYPAP